MKIEQKEKPTTNVKNSSLKIKKMKKHVPNFSKKELEHPQVQR